MEFDDFEPVFADNSSDSSNNEDVADYASPEKISRPPKVYQLLHDFGTHNEFKIWWAGEKSSGWKSKSAYTRKLSGEAIETYWWGFNGIYVIFNFRFSCSKALCNNILRFTFAADSDEVKVESTFVGEHQEQHDEISVLESSKIRIEELFSLGLKPKVIRNKLIVG